MSSSKTFFVSVAGGFIIATLLHVVAFSINNRTISGTLLWQDTLFFYVTGPGPLLFVDKQGTPHYEGTPIIPLILAFGYVVSLPVYSFVTFLFLKIFALATRGMGNSRSKTTTMR